MLPLLVLAATLTATPTYQPTPWPLLPFRDDPAGLGNRVVALTFDDGPDGHGNGQDNTRSLLDTLADLGVHATFFLCGHVWTDLGRDAAAQQDVRRMLAEGHEVGNHTYDHASLDGLTDPQITAEFSRNVDLLRQIAGPQARFTLSRAPYGAPYLGGGAQVPRVAASSAAYGVQVGWSIDSQDWRCAPTADAADCVFSNVTSQLAAGHSGVILMHAVYAPTVRALPRIVAWLNANGYRIVTVEALLQARYGAGSAEIMDANAAAHFSAAQIGLAAAGS